MIKKYYSIISKVSKEIALNISALGSLVLTFALSIILFTINKPLGIKLIMGLIIIEIVGNLIKIAMPMSRPDNEKYNNIIEKIHAGTMPSTHSARTAFIAFTIFKFTQNPLLGILLGLTALAVGISRMSLRRHFLLDVSIGYLIGFIVFLSIA